MATFKTIDRTGLNVSSIEVSESVRPAVEYRPAPWLPVKYYDTKLEDWIVIVSGEPVAAVRPRIQREGVTDIVPFSVLINGFSYDADDVGAGVMDIRTEQPLTSGGTATAVTVADIEAALGYTAGTLWDSVGSQPAGLVSPIGIASYNCLISADRGYINYEPQARVAVTCDYVIEVPVLGRATITVSGNPPADTAAGTAFTIGATPADFNSSVGFFDIKVNGNKVAGSAVASAGNISVTLQTLDVVTTDTVEVSYVSTTTAASPLIGGLPVFKGATLSQADIVPSVYVVVDTDNNFVAFDPTAHNPWDIVGQIIGVDNDFPKDFLDRVRTWYPTDLISKGYRGPTDTRLWATPGSATGGLNDRLYRALGTAYSGTVKINLLK